MYARKPPYRLGLLLLLVLLLTALTGTAVGKYIYSTRYKATVTFTAELAENLCLWESKATRDPEGDYTLEPDVTVASNDYILMPGVDIDKDPYIIVEGKTPVEAYLFVEIVETLHNHTLRYSVRSTWKKLDDLSGKNGGTVYVYAGTGADAAVLDENFSSDPVHILQDNKFYVDQALRHGETRENKLQFYASMGETASGTTPAEVYRAIP